MGGRRTGELYTRGRRVARTVAALPPSSKPNTECDGRCWYFNPLRAFPYHPACRSSHHQGNRQTFSGSGVLVIRVSRPVTASRQGTGNRGAQKPPSRWVCGQPRPAPFEMYRLRNSAILSGIPSLPTVGLDLASPLKRRLRKVWRLRAATTCGTPEDGNYDREP